MVGTVVSGSNNRFTVDCGEERYSCKIKGKILRDAVGFYNPLAPGDLVDFEPDAGNPGTGSNVALCKRRNAFSRWNVKGDKPQVLAANIDRLCCVVTPDEPPFRPRFIDRILVLCEDARVTPLIILNKADLAISVDVEERLSDYERIGYETCRVSAKTGTGIDDLVRRLDGKLVAFIGQSGAGKTSLLNRLCPGRNFRVQALSEKYGRGSHTTTCARLERIELGGFRYGVIDTPGIRSLAMGRIGRDNLTALMPEFNELAHQCSYSNCTHTNEPGCKILEAVYAGYIHEDRYESFLRIREELPNGY